MEESLPKLLPFWHGIALQDFVRRKPGLIFKSQYPPNYGETGIDVEDISSCRNLNSDKKQVTYAASSCALPFLPLKKITNIKDPCLEDLEKERFEFDKFCMKLTFLRQGIKSGKKEFCQKKISKLKDLQKQLSVLQRNNEKDNINIKVSKTLADLAKSQPKRTFIPKLNVAYAGGTISVSKSDEIFYFLHPGGENLHKLCITPLQNDSEKHFKPECHDQITASLNDKELILQIEPSISDYYCVRKKNSFHLVNMSDMCIFSKKVSKSSLYHVSVSPYNPLEILSIYEKGVMKLTNVETRKSLSISEDLRHPAALYPSWRCGFGSHFFSAMCMNEKILYSFDYREKNCIKREIYDIINPSCYVEEELVAMKQWNKNLYQHLLTTSHNLIICDERYPKKPVLQWNHTLKEPPIYLEYADLHDNVSCVVIGSQGTQELAAFLFSHKTDLQPISLTYPFLLSSPNDCIESLKLHSCYIDDKLSSRFSAPLTGICVIPKDKNAFTVLQSTSLGDIFYQDYKLSEKSEKTYHVSTGCVLTSPEKILPHLDKLMNESTDSNEIPDELDESITRLQININEILSLPKEISSNCMMCRLSDSSGDEKLMLSEICPRCNLSSSESHHLSKAATNLSAVIGPVSKESSFLQCDYDYLSEFKDTYSQRLLSAWLKSDNVGHNEATNNQSMDNT